MRERTRAGETSCFLFVSRLGSGMTPRAVYNVFEDAAFHAGIDRDRRNVHIAKHSLGVALRKAGVDLATIAKALGHRDPATTIRFYQHVVKPLRAVRLPGGVFISNSFPARRGAVARRNP